jgi:hypothetical protein
MNNDDDVIMMNQNQNQGQDQVRWHVTYVEDDDTEIFDRWADAWAYAQPDADGRDWRWSKKADIQARFDAGENNITVAWVTNDNRASVRISRVVL